MKASALRKSEFDTQQQHQSQGMREPESPTGFEPSSMRRTQANSGHADQSLRMYTEEEVSEMLQISLSQLRKWRMKNARRNGPPFKKIGRLVRYPGQSLQAYICDEDSSGQSRE